MNPENPQNNPNIIPPVQPVSEPVTNSENSSFLHSKWLRIGVVVVILLVLLGGTFVLGGKLMNKTQTAVVASPTPTSIPISTLAPTSSPTTTPNPTANWKTYTSSYTDNNFSVKYPSEYYLQPPFPRGGSDYIGDTKTSVDLFLAGNKLTSNNLLISLIELNENYNGLQGLANRIAGGTPNDVKFEIVTIYNVQSVKVIDSNNVINYGIPIKNGFVWISANPANSDLIRTFNQILSTFKFTNPTSDETTNAQNRVKDFYAKYLAGTPPARDVNQLKTDGYLTDNAVNQIKQTIGADLVTCSQSPLNASAYTYSTPQINNNTATMNVKGTYSGPPSSTITINLNLIRSGTNWTINSFSCAK